MEGETFDSTNIVEFWPSTVLDLIYQHLNASEVLSSTLVHRTWNEFLTYSTVAWKDIMIQPKVRDGLEYLVQSNRRYQHIRVVNISQILNDFLEIVMKKGRKWKSIIIFRTTFETSEQLNTILQSASKTVEHLDLNVLTLKEVPVKSSDEWIGILKNVMETNKSLIFPRLKHLKISYYGDENVPWTNTMFQSAPNLEFLQLSYACDQRMKEIILASVHLKRLSLSGSFQDDTFFKDLSLQLSSRLEEFEFNDILSSSRETRT